MNYESLRITKLREYLFGIIDGIVKDKKYQINANMLSNDINNYSLDKIPIEKDVEMPWIIGIRVEQDVYSFRSRKAYSQDVINNLENIGFFEVFESIIESNNKKGILPEIDGIESIECLNTGTMTSHETNTAEFYIQIQITYRKDLDREEISL